MHLLMMALVLPLFFAIVVALGLYHAPGPGQWAVSKLGAGGYAVAVHVLVYLMIGGVPGLIVGMGIAVPSPIWVMQPILPVAMTSGFMR